MLRNNFDYKPFLKEAYIDPIRTVTVIDDEYPTLEKLISVGIDAYASNDIDRLDAIIKISKSEGYNWLLDIYDGDDTDKDLKQVSNRLFHSDLLILDYHLDGEDDGACSKSLDIIKNLAENRHFNIVVVHTKGYTGEKGTANDVFCDIVASLQAKPKKLALSQALLTQVNRNLDEWEFENSNIRSELKDSISKLDTLLLVRDADGLIKSDCDSQILSNFNHLFESKPESVSLHKKILLKWLISKKLEAFGDIFPQDTYKYLEWGVDGHLNWLKTEDLFLTVLGKKETPVSDIPNMLLESMSAWKPHPHKLILSKLRNEIESKGISASSNILNKKHLQAAWLKELLSATDKKQLKTVTWNVVSKLWEELALEIKEDLSDFAVRMLNVLKAADGNVDNLLSYFVGDDRDPLEQTKQANCFSCSRQVSTHHVITGHILDISGNYWLCLTPICDLVPGQKIGLDGDEALGQLMPVTLVQMYDAKSALRATRENMIRSLNLSDEHVPILNEDDTLKAILHHSTQNNLLFIRPDGGDSEIKILSFTVGLDGKANPNAKQYYAKNQGIFDDEREVNLFLPEPCDKGMTLKVAEMKGKVVAELRYEYALNLLSRLGFSKSRVGLDFIVG